MGGVDCEVTEAHQFALLQYEEPLGQVIKELPNFGDNSIDVDRRTLSRKPKYSIVPPPGVVSLV